MSDIVERLREGVFGSDETKTDTVIHAHMQVAANEIERLREALCLIGRGDIPIQYPNTASGYRRYAAHVLAKETA